MGVIGPHHDEDHRAKWSAVGLACLGKKAGDPGFTAESAVGPSLSRRAISHWTWLCQVRHGPMTHAANPGPMAVTCVFRWADGAPRQARANSALPSGPMAHLAKPGSVAVTRFFLAG